MRILIDGYNLIHAAGIIPAGESPTSLEPARMTLLRFLTESLTPAQCAETVVVFDARDARPGLPVEFVQQRMMIRFAIKHDEADDLIEDLIRACSTPKRLTVVSSDHRIQKAALRRKAKPIDSEVWFDQQRFERRRRHGSHQEKSKPEIESDADAKYWMSVFGLERETAEPNAQQGPISDSSGADVFPPGYGEDLLDEEP